MRLSLSFVVVRLERGGHGREQAEDGDAGEPEAARHEPARHQLFRGEPGVGGERRGEGRGDGDERVRRGAHERRPGEQAGNHRPREARGPANNRASFAAADAPARRCPGAQPAPANPSAPPRKETIAAPYLACASARALDGEHARGDVPPERGRERRGERDERDRASEAQRDRDVHEPRGSLREVLGWKPGEDETGGWCIARVAGDAEVDAARVADRARTDAARRTRRRIAAGRGRRSFW